MTTESKPKKGTKKEAEEILELSLDEDRQIKIGDWKGSLKDFRKHWIPNSELKKLREQDKAQTQKQIEAEAARIAQHYQQQMYRQRQQQPQPQGNGGIYDSLSKYYDKVRTGDTQGFMTVEHFDHLMRSILVPAITAELQARDRVMGALGGRLDEWYGDYQKQRGTLDSLASTHTDSTWKSYIDSLEKEYPDLPRSTIEALASAYEASDGEGPDQLREGIKEAIGSHAKDLETHRVRRREAAREREQQVARAGIPGVGGPARPSQPQQALRTADEIVDHFMSQDEPAA